MVSNTRSEDWAQAPLRVAFVVHRMQVAGAEMLVREIIRHLGERLDPLVLCLDGLGSMSREMQDAGVDVRCLERAPGLDLPTAGRLAAALAQRDIEVVHAHQYGPFFYSALALWRQPRSARGQPPQLVLTEHGRHYPDHVRRRRRWANRWLLARQAHAITACCDFSRRALAENDGFPFDDITVIENGIDLSRFPPRSAADSGALAFRRIALGLDPSRRVVLSVARLHPVKDHRTLLDAFAQLTEVLPDVDLVLAGDGPLRGALERRTQELGIKDRVRFLGVRSDVPAWLRVADAFVLNSLSEAASLTLLEAMASGLAVVVTDVGGNPEIVDNEVHGLRVPRQDPCATARALETLLRRPEWSRELGANGRRKVEQHYRLQTTVDRYAALYADMMRAAEF